MIDFDVITLFHAAKIELTELLSAYLLRLCLMNGGEVLVATGL